ncbi:hypothetical protein XH96_33690 [Bradyrhizobium sp. CCBAU 51765]|nr:hypothetical protein XH96_33690 [Bradyrhizobium sp. CCBAU 51765]
MRLRRSPKPTDDRLNPILSKSLFGVDGAVRVMAAPQPGVREGMEGLCYPAAQEHESRSVLQSFGRRIKPVSASRMGPLRSMKIGKVWRPCSGEIEGLLERLH